MKLTEAARRSGLGALGLLGGAAILRRRGRFEDRAVVLAYHSVASSPDYASEGITASPDHFDAQLAYLKAHYNVVALDELVARISSGSLGEDRCVAITFDDGYADNCKIALPILERHGLRAAFFVTSDPVVKGAPFWVARMHRAVITATDFAPLRELLGLKKTPKTSGDAFNAVCAKVNWMGLEDRKALIQAAEDALQAGGATINPAPDAFMSDPDMIRQLKDAGMIVGAHSATHPILASLDQQDLTDELRRSKSDLEALLGSPVLHMAYPNGRGIPSNIDARVVEAARDAGYLSACTSIRGAFRQGDDPLAIPRIAVNARLGAHGFKWKLEQGFRAHAQAVPLHWRDAA